MASKIYQPSFRVRPNSIQELRSEQSKTFDLFLPRDEIPTTNTMISVADGKVKLPPLGFGTWAWGDILTYGWGPSGGYDKALNEDSCHAAFNETLKWFPDGAFFDTAEHYGYTDGSVEQNIGKFLSDERSSRGDKIPPVIVATKYLPTPWRHPWQYPDRVLQSKQESLDRMHLDEISIYQLHGPSNLGYWPRFETLADSLADAYESGKIKSIGVCNLNIEQIRLMQGVLSKRGLKIATSQVEFSLVRTDPLKNGLIEECRKMGIATIAYSPLAVGRLSGKYSEQNKPQGNRNFGDISWGKIQPIVDELLRLGEKYSKSPSQIALNWVICKGAIPIPTVKNAQQVDDCVGALGWKLSQDDEAALDKVSLYNAWDWNMFKHFQNWWWQQG